MTAQKTNIRLSTLARAARRTLAASAIAALTMACGVETAKDDSTPQDDTDVKNPALSLPDLGERGDHSVGHRTFEDPNTDVIVQAWYPTDAEEGPIEYEVAFQGDYFGSPTGKMLGEAAQDASLAEADAPFPVVVFSHGFSLNPEWYSTLTEHLASQGFVVLAPEHQEGEWDATVVDASFDRPLKVRQTIDLAEGLASEGAWEGRLDVTRVAVVGHSYGGYTALVASGAHFDAEALATECASLDPMAPKAFLCAPFSASEDVIERFRVANGTVHDERVSAVVSIAGDAYLFGSEGLSHVSVPTLAIGGTGDNFSPWDWGSELTYDSVGARAALVGLEGADHMIAVNVCDDMPWTSALPEEFSAIFCQDPAWDRDAALTVIQRFTTAFLLDTLRKDARARELLSESSVEEENVRYQATW